MSPFALVAFVATASAQDPVADPDPGATTVPRPKTAAVHAGAGAVGLIGGNGAGYAAGFAQHLAIDFAMSRIAWLTLDVDHSRHPLTDASNYFPDEEVPADSLDGTRDYLVLDVGARLDIDPGGGDAPPDRFRFVPYVRFGGGAAFTDTQLDAASFGGRQPIRSRAAAPVVSVGAGAAFRVQSWLSFVPGVKFQGLVARDDGEIDKQTSVGVEMRVQGVADVVITF